MWLVSNKQLQLIILFLGVMMALQTKGQHLVYDLKQEWVNYDNYSKGFLPINDQDYELNTIGFKLSNPGTNKFYLSVYVPKQAYLFYGTDLIGTLPKGTTNLNIDSLNNVLMDESPFLTIYGKNLIPGLKTEIRSGYYIYPKAKKNSPIKYHGDFINFFYISGTLLVLIFVIIRTRFAELADQYLLFSRAVRTRTIDELIYKIEYIAFPNAFFLLLISMTLSFTSIAFMYFFPGEVSILSIKPAIFSLSDLLINWATLTGVIFILLIAKYIFTRFLSSVFDLKVTNIHYASSLRLILILTIITFLLTLIQFFFTGIFAPLFFWIFIISGATVMVLIIFFKLSLVTTHTLLYIFVYLCATEIFQTVFLFKFFTI